MTTRPTRIAQTSTEAKKLFKQNGLQITERQQRQLDRDADLEKRAQGIREREQRSKANKKKCEEKERKEAALRRMNGVGLATQMIGYSRTQAQLKKGMEAFVGYKKKRDDEVKKKELEVAKQLEAVVEEVAKEPWDDDADDTFDIAEPSVRAGDQWMDDGLDDDTLLELHDMCMSDPVKDTIEAPKPQQIASSAPVTHSPKMAKTTKQDVDFIRLHGPINKMIDSILDKLPEPLIELLSQDCSIDQTTWDPSSALLHKLNPPGLPPHRLRIKVGCVVSLLRDLNTSSQLSKSQHLQILRVEQERLECLVLDGQLEGTKTFLTKVSFAAKHRNDNNCLYQRVQFPIQVSKDFPVPVATRKISQAGFKKPTPTSQAPQPSTSSSKRLRPTPKVTPQSNKNPSFKLPGLPASKAKPTMPPPVSVLDGWDDFLDSATQIARDLSSEPSSPCKPQLQALPNAPACPAAPATTSLLPLSTQDFDFSLEDLDLFPILSQKNQNIYPQPTKTMASSPVPAKSSAAPQPKRLMPGRPDAISKPASTGMKPPQPPTLKRKFSESSNNAKTNTLPKACNSTTPARRDDGPAAKRPAIHNMGTNNTTTTVIAKATSNVSAKRGASKPQMKALPSFSEFGLSTQEAVSFFDDDDELAFGSPPIMV